MDRFKWFDQLPAGLRIRRLLRTIWSELTFPQSCAPGHFYSPIPSHAELVRDRQRIFGAQAAAMPELDLRESAQLRLLSRLGTQAASLHFPPQPVPVKRFYLENDYFFSPDARVFAAMLLEHRPRRYVEIGSGFSSALALDLRAEFFGGELTCVFIEPDTERLQRLLTAQDRENVIIHESRVQSVSDRVFRELAPNDILFVDGSHVSKAGSDLNDVVFRVLPLLHTGVLIHFHDIYWPFEYLEKHVMCGTSWNEAYLLRAYLANNVRYRIEFFSSWLEQKHAAEWQAAFPEAGKGLASSLWLRKVGTEA
jgi:predicted O-methyltransferase YrrM